ncbi:hypothetical protein LG296_01740 [Ureibacillus chungkukjangi]|uniref:hypothetical protein n=1 Tax=Ureibacillus chungkukjangi TaxID=1202712 RepID=UPI00385010EB
MIIDHDLNLYMVKDYGLITVVNMRTKELVWSKSMGTSTTYPANHIHEDVDGNLLISCSGNLAGINLYKINKAGSIIWTVNSVMVNGAAVTTDSIGNVYYVGYGNSGNSETKTLMSYTKDGVLRWSKTYAEQAGAKCVLYNPVNNLIYVLNTTNTKLYDTEGNLVATYAFAIDSQLQEAQLDFATGEIFTSISSNVGRYTEDGVLKWSTPISVHVRAIAISPEYIYVSRFSSSEQNGIIKVQRYTKYYLL